MCSVKNELKQSSAFLTNLGQFHSNRTENSGLTPWNTFLVEFSFLGTWRRKVMFQTF